MSDGNYVRLVMPDSLYCETQARRLLELSGEWLQAANMAEARGREIPAMWYRKAALRFGQRATEFFREARRLRRDERDQ